MQTRWFLTLFLAPFLTLTPCTRASAQTAADTGRAVVEKSQQALFGYKTLTAAGAMTLSRGSETMGERTFSVELIEREAADAYEACEGADVLAILTEWDQFRWLDYTRVVKAMAKDGTVLFENRVGAGDVDRATFNAPPGFIALEMALQSSSGTPLDTDYRGISVPNLRVSRPTLATPQVLRTRTARSFTETSQNAEAIPVASRTFSRTERLLIRVPAYGPNNIAPVVTARLLNRRGTPMRQLEVVDGPLPPGTIQFDLPLVSLAPDEYRVELVAANPTGNRDEAKELLPIRVTN